MQLDVIVATYNRKELLARTIRSLLGTPAPQGLQVRVTVVDNNSTDGTRESLAQLPEFGGRLSYIFEPRQGKSYALNTAMAAVHGDLVGFVDDDEEIDGAWYGRIFSAFQDPLVDYIGGTTLPKWSVPPPPWIPPSFRAVVGWVDAPAGVREYGAGGFAGVLMGGNAVIRRSVLQALGTCPYDTSLGRRGRGLLTADDDMHRRLTRAGARGLCYPDLIVHHHVQLHMATKRYYRRWCFWNSVTQGTLEKRQRSPVPHLLGLPRWHYRQTAEAFIGYVGRSLFPTGRPDLRFAAELTLIQFAGLFYGRHFFRRNAGS